MLFTTLYRLTPPPPQGTTNTVCELCSEVFRGGKIGTICGQCLSGYYHPDGEANFIEGVTACKGSCTTSYSCYAATHRIYVILCWNKKTNSFPCSSVCFIIQHAICVQQKLSTLKCHVQVWGLVLSCLFPNNIFKTAGCCFIFVLLTTHSLNFRWKGVVLPPPLFSQTPKRLLVLRAPPSIELVKSVTPVVLVRKSITVWPALRRIGALVLLTVMVCAWDTRFNTVFLLNQVHFTTCFFT